MDLITLLFLLIPTIFISHVEAQPTCTVFIKNYLERCYYTTKPKPEEIRDEIRIFASPGEYEPCTFCVRAGEKMEGVTVSVNDLESGNRCISKEHIDIRVVKSFNRWVDPMKFIKTECYLVKEKETDIAKDTTQRFWLTVYIPEEANPGRYQSQITIKTKAGIIKTLKLQVEVLPIKLLSPEGMGYFMYYNTALTPKFAQNQEYQEKCFIDMKRHGLTTTTLYLYPLVGGKITLTEPTDGNLGFSPTMETLKKTNLVLEGIPVIWIGAECYGQGVWDTVLKEAKERNWPEIVFYVVDEPGDEERNKRVRSCMEKINEFRRQHPEYKIRTITAIGRQGIETVGEYYDIWICSAMDIDEEMIEKAKGMGKELWSYDCALAPVDAETDRYYFGLFAWRTGIKGCSHWAYCDKSGRNRYGQGVSWDDYQKNIEDITIQFDYIFPSPEGPIPSIGWEAIREGIDDYRYLLTLKKLIEKAEKDGKEEISSEAEKIIKEIENKVDPAAYGKAYQQAKSFELKESRLYNRPSPEQDISREDYDQFRYKIAQEIIKLQNILDK